MAYFIYYSLYFLKYLYLFLAVSSLNWGRWDLPCSMHDLSLQLAGSVVATRGLSCSVAYEILVLRPGIKSTSPPLEGRFLTTGPPEKSLLNPLLLSCPFPLSSPD